MKRNVDFIIAVDPDVDKSGVACLQTSAKKVECSALDLPTLVDYLRDCSAKGTIIVVVEAGWLNGGNHHLRNKGQYHAAKLGEYVGRNHEISKQIAKFCEHYQIDYEFKRPLAKCWHGTDRKISKDELDDLLSGSGLAPIQKRTNQEMRDAVLLAMDYSGIPLRMKKKR